MIILNKVEYLLEWLNVAIVDITLVPKSKLYSLLKEGWKWIPYVTKYLSLSFLSNRKGSLLLGNITKIVKLVLS
jgi:hypothetical protein